MDEVVVFGATGDQGAAQLRALLRAGRTPVAISRKGLDIHVDGRVVRGLAADFGDPASLARAVEAGSSVFLNLPSTSFQPSRPLIEAAEVIASAARKAGIGALIFNTSLPVPAEKRGFAAQDARHEIRACVFADGPPAIVLQPVVFLDNLLKAWAWPSISRENTIVYAHRETLEVSWICHDDLAALMVAALERPHLAGRVFDVGGPDTVRGADLARRLGAAWRRPLGFRSQSIDDFCAGMQHALREQATLDAGRVIGELRRIYTWYNEAPEHPFKVDMRPVLEALPVRLTSIEEWAARQSLPA